MEKELTVKVNYVLGNGSAFDAAAHAADQVNKKVEGFGQWMKSQFPNPGGSMTGLLMGGVGSLASAGVISKAAGLASSDLISGGNLRGHGFSGMNDAFWGMVTGRGTIETMQDMKMHISSSEAARSRIGIGGLDAGLAAVRSGMFRPSTEVDPIRRMAEERSLMLKTSMQAQLDYNKVTRDYDRDRANINFIHDQKADNSEQGKLARQIGLRQVDQGYLAQKEKFTAEDLQRTTQLNQFDKSIYEGRKSQMRGSQMQWGQMTLAEQQSHKIALDLLKNKQPLMPEQIAQLHNIPEAKEALDEYLQKQGKESGHAAAVAGLKGDMGRANAIASGVKSSTGIDIDPEDFLESKTIFEQSAKLKEMLSKALGKVIADVTNNEAWLTAKMAEFGNQRTALGPNK